MNPQAKVSHYCPVCHAKLPESAYGEGDYFCCFSMFGLEKSGFASTGWGTIRLGTEPGEYTTIFPKEKFERAFDRIRQKQASGAVRWQPAVEGVYGK